MTDTNRGSDPALHHMMTINYVPQPSNLGEDKGFWDVRLICANKAWLLRSDVLLQCRWFKRALEGVFEDPSHKIIEIQAFDADSVGWLVKHLYTNECNWEELQGERTFTQLCLHVFDMGEYFELPYLTGSAAAGFRRMLFTMMPVFQANNSCHEGHTAELLKIIREVYAQENPRVRMAFGSTVAMVLDAIRFGVKGMWVHDLIEEIPAVAVDMVKFALRRRNPLQCYPDSCDGCKTPQSANLGFSSVRPPVGKPGFMCWHCDGQAEDMSDFGIHMNRNNV
ncbi:hypothetical protein F5B21DRAFT_504628 [Xylaria acuta]|nr:hypothetical protein F5B21DRAFT_504628 [Xylaria acuta]